MILRKLFETESPIFIIKLTVIALVWVEAGD